MAFVEEAAEFRSQALHLFGKGLAIVLLLGNAYIATWSEDEVLRFDVGKRADCSIALLVLERALAVVAEGLGNAFDVLFREFTQFARHHSSHVACVHE